jgi:lipopolysaccharide export system protein LptA
MKRLANTSHFFRLPTLVGMLGSLLLMAHMGHAEKADNALPMNAQADAVRHDEQKQVTELTGNVVVTKGSIVMRGGRIEVRTDAAGNQSATIYAVPGGMPAFFRQKRDGVNEFIEGEAEQIDYAGAADTITLQRRAVMRRLAGAMVQDELKGGKIVYDNTSARYFVDGGPLHASAQNPSGRVTAIIAAKPKNAAAPASPPASAPAPALRVVPKIGDTVK